MEEQIQFQLLKNNTSSCISINNKRVSDCKLYGFGKVITSCTINKDYFNTLIENKESVQIYIIDNGLKGIWVDGINISKNGTINDYNKHVSRIEYLKKKCSKKYHPNLLQELYEKKYWIISTKNIKEAF